MNAPLPRPGELPAEAHIHSAATTSSSSAPLTVAMADPTDHSASNMSSPASPAKDVFQLQSFPLFEPLTPPPARRIPRPANAFMLFRSDFLRKNQAIADMEKKQQTLSKLAGRVWREMSEEEKGEWREKAEQVKCDHRKAYPDYKFTPSRGSARSKVRAGESSSEDRDGPKWVEELHRLVTPQSSPVRRNRSLRRQQQVPKVEGTKPPQLNLFSSFPLHQPILSPSFPLSFLSPPRRPSSAPGFRPSLASMSESMPSAESSSTDMIISPDGPHFMNITPVRRPSTALGVRSLPGGNVADVGQLGIQPINTGLYEQPRLEFNNPFSVASISHGIDALSLREMDLPFGPAAYVSPLDPSPSFLTYPSSCFLNHNNYATKSTSPTTSDMSIDSPAMPLDTAFNSGFSANMGYHSSFLAGLTAECAGPYTQPMTYGLPHVVANPFAGQNYRVQHPTSQ